MQAVKRNLDRFPSDFMFSLTAQEVRDLKSQNVILDAMGLRYWGRRRKAPFAFSEQGVAMLSSVLRSARAITVNIAIMRIGGHDEAIAGIVRAIRELAAPSPATRRRIGFV